MRFFTHSQAVRAIESLKSVPAYNDILQLERLDEESAAIDQVGQQLLDLCRFEPSKVEGKVPPKDYASLKHQSTYSNITVGLQNMQQYKRLEDYLKLNGGIELYSVQMKGACMFASLRRCIDCPLEFSNTHLRRQIVTVTENPEFFWPVLAQHIKGNYGHLRIDKATYDRKKGDGTITQQEKEDYECPGPFSLIGYLKALLKRKFWGDEMVLMISSMMWQVGITVLTGETLRCIKFRHSNALPKTDVILVRSGDNHYVPAGEFVCILYRSDWYFY